ncbi:MAG: glutathione S-transferase [Gammaproteobacteria bacterium]|nr:glutathione S-transferase [Gammaproteobacteria bacterium]
MKLYDCKTAPSPRRVRIFAAEKGVALQTVPVDLANGEQFSAEYRAINPDCVVPALELDDGTCLSEVVAICQYLEELYPEPPLFGRTPAERAMSLMWNAKAEQQGLWACADAFRNTAKGLKGRALPGPDDYEQIPELAERGRQRALAFLQRLDQQLGDDDYVAGDYFSIADVTALIFVDFATRLKIGIPDEATNLRRWYDAVSSRPSAAA